MSELMTDQRLDRMLAEFLDAEVARADRRSSVDQMVVRVSTRVASRRGVRLDRPVAWVFAVLGLVMALLLALGLSGGRPDLRGIDALSPSALNVATSVRTILATAAPSAESTAASTNAAMSPAGSGPMGESCLQGTAASTEVHDPTVVGPSYGLVAYQAGPGIWVTGEQTTDGRQVWGPEGSVPGMSADTPGAVLLGWSPDGSELMVQLQTQRGSRSGCSDLVLVAADGSRIVNLTSNRVGQTAEGGVFSPDGRNVAYNWTDGFNSELRLVDLSGTTRVLDARSCGRVLAWSPNGQELAVACNGARDPQDGTKTTVYSVDDGTSHVIALPTDQTGTGAMAWSLDGRAILEATSDAGLRPPGLAVSALDTGSGSSTIVSRSDRTHVDWTQGFPPQDFAFSPDRRHLLALNCGYCAPSASSLPAGYVLDVATGATAKLLSASDHPNLAQWLPDSSGLVFTDGSGRLMRINADGTARTTIGSIPQGAVFAWHSIGP